MRKTTGTGLGRPRIRRLGLLGVAISLAIVMASASQGAPPDARAGPGEPKPTKPVVTVNATGIVFGTLGSIAYRAAAENAAGVRGATIELDWSAYEPARGQFSTSYTNEIIARVKTFRDAGQELTLALGIHYTPQWVRDLPDAVAMDQRGSRRPGADMVFSQPVRDAVSLYLARIDRDLGMEIFTYIRLTSGGNAEMLYNTTGSYAAFSRAAQNGSNRARGMPANPFPGWKPGGRNLSTDQVRRWADWYVGALANVTKWQIGEFDRLGFKGVYQAITPGAGVRPDQYARAIKDFLPDGLLGIGGAWQTYYASLAGTPRLMTYVSSLADGSAGNNYCDRTDHWVSVTSTTANPWSATRWQSRLAVEYGFSLGGENPGYGDGVAVLPYYTDSSSAGMLAVALRQATRCNFKVFNFAHDQQLWKGPLSLSAYVEAINAAG